MDLIHLCIVLLIFILFIRHFLHRSLLAFLTNPVPGNALDELSIDDLQGALDRELESESPAVSNSISVGLASAGLLVSSAPVNIPAAPRSGLGGFSPTNNSPLASFLNATSHFAQTDHAMDFLNHSQMQSLSSSASKYSNFFDFQNISPNSRSQNNFSMSPSLNSSLEIGRLREELRNSHMQINNCEKTCAEYKETCAYYEIENKDLKFKLQALEAERLELLGQEQKHKVELDSLHGGPNIRSIAKVSELSKLPLCMLKNIQAQLRQDLEEVEKVLYRETANKCMACEERQRTVTLNCNHFVLCSACALTQSECPYCQTPSTLSNMSSNI